MTEPRQLGVAACYDEALDIHRARLTEINITHQTFERLLGWTPGKVGKVYGDAQVKRMTVLEFFEVLQALAMKIAFVEDLEAAEKMADRWEKRVRPDVSASRHAYVGEKQIQRMVPAVLHAMQKRSTKAKSKRVRRRAAKKAAIARWRPNISKIRQAAAFIRWHGAPVVKPSKPGATPLSAAIPAPCASLDPSPND